MVDCCYCVYLLRVFLWVVFGFDVDFRFNGVIYVFDLVVALGFASWVFFLRCLVVLMLGQVCLVGALFGLFEYAVRFICCL